MVAVLRLQPPDASLVFDEDEPQALQDAQDEGDAFELVACQRGGVTVAPIVFSLA
ncbi:hypothetical protein D3C80_2176680 [compost metagenome]